MAFKVYDTLADYNADKSLQSGETRISLIRYEDAQKTSLINLVRYDAVNRVTTQPMIGDLVFINNENPSNPKIVFREGGKYSSGAKPADWEFVGFVYFRDGKNIGVIHKYGSNRQWLDVAQYAWTDPVLDGTQASKTIGIRCALNWNVNTTITLIDYQVPQYKAYDGGSDMVAKAEAMEYLAGEMQTAIETQLTAAGATVAEIALWHCYVQYKTPSPNSEIAYTSDGGNNTPLRIIIQRDTCVDYRFYNCLGLTHVTWQRWDKAQNENQGGWVSMSENSSYYKVNGKTTNYRGLMNFARGEAHWSNGGRTPTANIAVGSEAGNTDPVKKTTFEESDYCAALREHYGTYNAYLRGEFGIQYPQNYGAFSLPDGETMARDWASEEVPTKGFKTQNGIDTTKFKKKFPAMWFGRSLYGSSPSSEQTAHIALLNKFKHLATGQWHLPSPAEGIRIMHDETMEELQNSTTNVGTGIATAINNSTHRWWAARYNVCYAWFFNGNGGTLHSNYVNYGLRAQAVTLLDLNTLNDAPEGQTE